MAESCDDPEPEVFPVAAGGFLSGVPSVNGSAGLSSGMSAVAKHISATRATGRGQMGAWEKKRLAARHLSTYCNSSYKVTVKEWLLSS